MIDTNRSKESPLVQLAAEGIECELLVRAINNRERSATYELLISNHSDVRVSCRLYGVEATMQTREYGMVTVGERSAGGSLFSIPLETGDRRRLYVEVVGKGINLYAEALAPAVNANEKWLPWIATLAVLIVSVGGTAYAFERPTIDAFAVPTASAPGEIAATYSVGGKSSVWYVARLASGSIVARGSLPARSGDFAIPLPDRASGHDVRVSLFARGPFGATERTKTVAVGDENVETPARIESLVVRRDDVSGSRGIVASYDASGKSGTLRIVNDAGDTLATAPYSPSGTSRLRLSGRAPAGRLRAQLEVDRGPTRALASIIVPAERQDAIPQGTGAVDRLAYQAVTASYRLPTQAAVSPSDPFFVSSRVVAGKSFDVSIRNAKPGMSIAFRDSREATIDQVNVPPHADRVTLSAPASTTVETYSLTSTVPGSSPKRSSVQMLQVYPH